MKVGDSVPVTIAGQVVAQASVKAMEEGKVTLIVPGTLVVMATRTELAYEEPNPVEETTDSGTEHVILGVEEKPVAEDVQTITPAAEAPVAPAAQEEVEPEIKGSTEQEVTTTEVVPTEVVEND